MVNSPAAEASTVIGYRALVEIPGEEVVEAVIGLAECVAVLHTGKIAKYLEEQLVRQFKERGCLCGSLRVFYEALRRAADLRFAVFKEEGG